MLAKERPVMTRFNATYRHTPQRTGIPSPRMKRTMDSCIDVRSIYRSLNSQSIFPACQCPDDPRHGGNTANRHTSSTVGALPRCRLRELRAFGRNISQPRNPDRGYDRPASGSHESIRAPGLETSAEPNDAPPASAEIAPRSHPEARQPWRATRLPCSCSRQPSRSAAHQRPASR